MTTQQPRLVGGRYELGELIGYGGMAEVHRGRDIRLGRDVAIKVLRADLARDPSFLNRFRREAQAAAGLNHPSIVAVYDTGEDVGADGVTQPYIVMEYVVGRTLRDIIKTEGRLPARRVMEIGADICGALDFSHRNGIIHRDIKPANVMITSAGAVKVMDFGIARAAGDNSATVTQTANVIGTAQYLSPEQARGETVDARSDVYSTGCVLYELATGTPPFTGDSPVAVAYQHVRENAAPPSSRSADVPPVLDSVVMKALAKNPANRYQSAGEMRTDLQRALANQAVAAESVMSDAERTQLIARTPPPPVALVHTGDATTEPDSSRRTGLIWLAIVVALLLVIGGIVGVVLFTRNHDKGTTQVAIPSVVGDTPAAAQAALKAAGFTSVTAGADTSGTCDGGRQVQKGLVCTTSPKAGTRVPTTQLITYSLFSPATVQVPAVQDLTWDEAAQKVHDAQLTPRRKNVPSSQPAGQVIDQNPKPYATVAPGSTVTLSVSTGKVVLPDVQTGNPKLADAERALYSAGFTNIDASQTVPTTSQALDQTVASESPIPGIAYPTGQKITLTVYAYTPPPPTTPPPSTSAPATSPAPSGSSSAPTTPPPGPSS